MIMSFGRDDKLQIRVVFYALFAQRNSMSFHKDIVCEITILFLANKFIK